MLLRVHILLFVILAFVFGSCVKPESAIVLPPHGTASVASVDMGMYYDKQIYFDFETGKAVYVSDPASWDLAFETAPDGRHVFENGGKPSVFVYNTHQTDLNAVMELPAQLSPIADTFWQYDNPNGLPGCTAIGTWWKPDGSTKGEVYIVRLKTVLYKMRILSANADSFQFEWMPLYSKAPSTSVTLRKDSNSNYVYFSFKDGVTRPEPPNKQSWDVVFTQYRELVYDTDPAVLRALPYVVTGVLLNPWKTQAADDSSENFTAIDFASSQRLNFSSDRNAIGYDWKTVDINMATGGGSANYAVNPRKCYVLSTQEGQWYKLHFLSFYNPANGQKGAPMFEYERLK
ncbi:MAG: hypothetical protein JST06_11690 [Bacteroidetes bacterium]|nr:hypothetical protein [Bacteroidota bacterium]MBS1629729.1 hypothetical protein [Bacteroidota bacterium]